jgi:N-acetylglucosaminyldiphosphoundecaprenol N-acetyl-beta-D-mannosaminyltransferase
MAPFTMQQTLDAIDTLIAQGVPRYFITANLNYAMLVDRTPRLLEINDRAAFILADGKPLVWATMFSKPALPERVAGSDLLPKLCEHAVTKNYRLFFLGGAPGTAEAAAETFRQRYPGVQIVGIECPPFRDLTAEEHAGLIERIRAAKPHILFVAYGQPKGEYWMDEHLPETGVPVAVQIGGTFDFFSGRLKRAPVWMRKTGLEWVFRFLQEPRRLGGRYAANILFLTKMVGRGMLGLNRRA